MGDKQQQQSAPSTSTSGSSSGASSSTGISGNAQQSRAMRTQRSQGNSAAQQLLAGGQTDDLTWRERGNLIGSPPVRSEDHPPNTGIVEDQAVYNQRYSAANAQW